MAQVLGERMVLAANGTGGLATVALRPSGIFGERDPLLVPLTVAKARQGKMKYVIGSGANLMDFTYVGNVAQAHVLVRVAPMSQRLTLLDRAAQQHKLVAVWFLSGPVSLAMPGQE